MESWHFYFSLVSFQDAELANLKNKKQISSETQTAGDLFFQEAVLGLGGLIHPPTHRKMFSPHSILLIPLLSHHNILHHLSFKKFAFSVVVKITQA